MSVLVTGSAGHLGEALMRSLRAAGRPAVGVDIKQSPYTDSIGSICDRAFVRASMFGVRAVLHAATLHKPHLATHAREAFVETNIAGTLNLPEEAVAAGVRAFVFTSTTSAFGSALTPGAGEAAAWVTEKVVPIPKTSTASRSSQQRTCASCSTASSTFPRSCCERRGSFPKPMITLPFEKTTA